MIEDIYLYIENSPAKIIGITGNAGAGKSSLAKYITTKSTSYLQYSSDYKFIGDSKFRKELLERKAKDSIASYIDACNQYNWWNWEEIYTDLQKLKKHDSVTLKSKYNRDVGKTEEGIILNNNKDKKILYEGALLGDNRILNLIDVLFFITTEPEIRLKRIIEKDKERRTLNDICSRFLITEYSENLYYESLFKTFKKPIFVLDQDYNILAFNKKKLFPSSTNYIPIPIHSNDD